MEKTNRIAEDAENKLQTLNSLSLSAKNLGDSTDHMNKSILAISDEVAAPPEKYRDFMEKATVLTETAARVYYRFQSEKQKTKWDETDDKPKRLPIAAKKEIINLKTG